MSDRIRCLDGEVVKLENSTLEILERGMDLEATCCVILGEAADAVDADNGSVLIFNREKQVFEIAAAVGAEPPDKVTLGPGEGIAGRVYLAENAELVNKVAADPRFKPEVFHFLHHLRSSEGRV